MSVTSMKLLYRSQVASIGFDTRSNSMAWCWTKYSNPTGQSGRNTVVAPPDKASWLHSKTDRHGQAPLIWCRQAGDCSGSGSLVAQRAQQPCRKREQTMQGYRSPGGLQRFVATHSAIPNCFCVPARCRSALTIQYHRLEAFDTRNAASRAA